MSKVLITGVAGFVGSSIARELLAAGGDVVVGIDAFTDYYDPALKRANVAPLLEAGLTLIEGDLNTADLSTILEGVDVVFHEAGQPGVRASWGSEFHHYTQQNVAATQRLLEAARAAGVGRLVYASSSSVYGDAESYPTSEDLLPRPISPYGVTKLAAEHLVTLYGTQLGLSTVSLRYFTVYGPRQRPDMAFTRFLRAAVADEPVTVFGTGEQIREFTYVGDIVKANLAAARADLSPGTVLNLSGGSSVSVNDVLDVLSDIVGREVRVDRVDRVRGDVFRTGGSTDRARDLLGWRPEVSLEEGLRQQHEWVLATSAAARRPAVFQDFRRNALITDAGASAGTRLTAGAVLRAFFTLRVQAVLLFRLSQAVGRRVGPLGGLVKQFNQLVTGADIAWQADVGPGLILFHPVGVVVGPAVTIGERCSLQQGVTLGGDGVSHGPSPASPILGDDVVVGAGARVIGAVRIDSRCIVGANAVVTKPSPGAGMVAVGIPARWREGRGNDGGA